MRRLHVFLFLAVCGSAAAQTETVSVYDLYEQTVHIDESFEDPYDGRCVAVDAAVTRPDDIVDRLPLFFDGENRWRLRYTPSHAGRYRVVVGISRQGKKAEVLKRCSFRAEAAKKGKGFIRISTDNSRIFAFDDGAPFFPLGENMGWLRSDDEWKRYLEKLGATGANWIRIWMCSWGKLALVWKKDSHGRIYHGLDAYSLANARRFDYILKLAAENGIFIQLVFNNHGQFSSRTNPEWHNNPYNKKNGGFLDSPEEFFVNERCRRRYKDRLRYMVARFGWSTNLFAWELWNEVNLTDKYDPSVVGGWHQEMAKVLKEYDPFDHPVTTSGSGSFRGHQTFGGMDFLQSHEYTPDVINAVLQGERAVRIKYPKVPHFFGELGSNWRGPSRSDKQGVDLHDMLWASIHSAGSGAAMTWWWDNWVDPNNLYHHFKYAASYVDGINWIEEDFKQVPAAIKPKAGNRGLLRIQPMAGWRKSAASVFDIRPDGSVAHRTEVPSFIQGRAHPDLATRPVFVCDLEKSGTFEVVVDRIAKTGAALAIVVDGKKVFDTSYASGEKDYRPEKTKFRVPLAAGKHRIELSNNGSDWVRISEYRVDGAAQRLLAAAIAGTSTALLWIKDRSFTSQTAGSPVLTTVPTEIEIRHLPSGAYRYERWDPWKGEVCGRGGIRVADGSTTLPLPSFTRYCAFKLFMEKNVQK